MVRVKWLNRLCISCWKYLKYIFVYAYNNVGGDFAVLNENCKNPVVFSADSVEGVCASFVFFLYSGSEGEIRFLFR